MKTAFTVALAILCAAAAAWAGTIGPNLSPSPGFEVGYTGWRLGSTRWRLVGGVAYTGRYSLRIANTDKNSYSLATAPITCSPLRTYLFSARIKTENVTGAYAGATIALEWSDSQHRWIGGHYVEGIRDTTDWTLVSAESNFLPANARYLQVTLYVERGYTGTAWFDDVTVQLTDRDPEVVFRPLMRYPNYRETIYAGAPKRLDISAEVTGNRQYPITSLVVDVAVTDPGGGVVARAQQAAVASKLRQDLSVDMSSVPPGDYDVTIALVDKRTASVVQRSVQSLRVEAPDAPLPRVYIDQYNRCVVDGTLFLPLGFYAGERPGYAEAIDDLDRLADSKFNCLMMYGVHHAVVEDVATYLDAVNSRGLKLICSLNDLYTDISYMVPRLGSWEGAEEVARGMVSTFKDHPAILTWYINDELKEGYLPQLADRYAAIRQIDPDHPTWQVLGYGQNTKAYVASTDVLGIDYYPVKNAGTADLAGFGSATQNVSDAVMGARGMWMVPQACSLEAYLPGLNCRQPTFAEALCMPCMALVHGARGLIFYSLFDIKRTTGGEAQWNVMKRVGEVMDSLQPFALGLDVPVDSQITTSNTWIHILTRDAGAQTIALVANPWYSPVTATFGLGRSLKKGKVEAITPGLATRQISAYTGVFTDQIEPLGVRIYKLAK